MTSEDGVLAVLLRKAQWLLDDAAHAIPEGTYSPEEHGDLADVLDQLAEVVRKHAAQCVVIDESPAGQA